jgi:hypothetical protein
VSGLSQPPWEHRRDHRRQPTEGHQDRHDPGQLVTFGDIDHHSPGDYRGQAAAESLHDPEHDQSPDGRREGAADGSEGADRATDDYRHPPAALVRPRPTEQLPRRHAEEERGQGQTDQRRWGGEVGGDLRERWGVHVSRERRHRTLQSQREDQRRSHRRRGGRLPTLRRFRQEERRGVSASSHHTTTFMIDINAALRGGPDLLCTDVGRLRPGHEEARPDRPS